MVELAAKKRKLLAQIRGVQEFNANTMQVLIHMVQLIWLGGPAMQYCQFEILTVVFLSNYQCCQVGLLYMRPWSDRRPYLKICS